MGEIVYTYDTYTCDYRSPTLVYEQIGNILSYIKDKLNIGSTSTCETYLWYDPQPTGSRYALLFLTVNRPSQFEWYYEKMYHVEIKVNEDNTRLLGVKVYISPLTNLCQNVSLGDFSSKTEDIHAGDIIYNYYGIIAKGTVDGSENSYKVLYGVKDTIKHTVEGGGGVQILASEFVIPPKSFFIAGKHEDFIPGGKYEVQP